ncbi:T9SS type A sorting domain-containing protein [bacterium]|nr:T9SS type A sorting domain-containing protein [bacterium]
MRIGALSLLILCLLLPAFALANYLGDVETSHGKQAWIAYVEHIDITFSYKVDDAAGARIMVLPYTNGMSTPHLGWSGSPLYAQGEGLGSSWCSVWSGDVVVDQIQITLWTEDWSEQLLELFIPVEYNFSAKGISDLTFSHSSPSWIQYGEFLYIDHGFTTDEPGLLFARPFYQGALVPDYSATGGPEITPPFETVSHHFTINSGPSPVDAIRFQFMSLDQTEILWEAYVPVKYQWDAQGLSNFSFDWDPPQYLSYEQRITCDFDYSTDDPDGVRVWAYGAFDDEVIISNYYGQGSAVLPAPSGSGDRFFGYNGDQDINQIGFVMTDEEQTETYLEVFVPFDAAFRENVVNQVTFSPGAPAILDIPEVVWTSYSYVATGTDSFRILNYGYSNGEWADTWTGVGDHVYPPSGIGANDFYYEGPPILIDQVRFNMQTDRNRETIGNSWYPTLHIFGTSAVATTTPEETPSVATQLLPNFPNPFNPKTNLRFTMSEAGKVQLGIYDIQGRLLRVLIDQSVAAGLHQVEWDGHDAEGVKVSSGIYFSKLLTKDDVQTSKLVLVK